jgi:hypothetical protein
MSLIDEARTVRDRILARLSELEPLVREYNELRQLAGEMGLDIEPVERAAGPAAPADPAAPRAQRRTSGTRSRPSSAGTGPEIAERVLAAVTERPGETVAGYAEILGLSPTSLYRPVRELTNDGRLVKRARQLFLPD